jgi:hypothetical protein
MLPQWRMRASAKMNASETLFMAEKAPTRDDFLMSDDGVYLLSPMGTPALLVRNISHNPNHAFGHGRNKESNAIMADGSIRTLVRGKAKYGPGMWHFGIVDYQMVDIQSQCCQ